MRAALADERHGRLAHDESKSRAGRPCHWSQRCLLNTTTDDGLEFACKYPDKP
jgi:hypothetical protein